MRKIALRVVAILLAVSILAGGCASETQAPAPAPTPTVLTGRITDVDVAGGRVTIVGMYDEQEIYVEVKPETRIILGDEECDLKTLEREWNSASGDIIVRVVCLEGERTAYWMFSDYDIADIK